jgi:PAS domain-containing protein
LTAGTEPVALTINASGWVLQASAAAEQLFSFEPGEMIGFHVSLLLPTLTESSIASDRQLRHLKYLGHCGISFKATRSDGRGFLCSLLLVPLRDEAQDIYRLIINEAEHDTAVFA